MFTVTCYVDGSFSYKVKFDFPLDVAMFLEMTLSTDTFCNASEYRYIVSRDE